MRLVPVRLEPHLRVSLHTFRWGIHFKMRMRDHWFHAIAKVARGSAFGEKRRRQLWIGWFRSYKGHRRPLHGWRLVVAVDRLGGLVPRETMRGVTIYPNRPRDRNREFEVR